MVVEVRVVVLELETTIEYEMNYIYFRTLFKIFKQIVII
jgi:hypothetical protein